eukprot:scaffold42595_cov30-Phaeocystis_antarctica.AAC.1
MSSRSVILLGSSPVASSRSLIWSIEFSMSLLSCRRAISMEKIASYLVSAGALSAGGARRAGPPAATSQAIHSRARSPEQRTLSRCCRLRRGTLRN